MDYGGGIGMSKIHVLPDENLGGVLREYAEVERKANIGDLIKVKDSDVIKVAKIVGELCVYFERNDDGIYHHEYSVLEPTDIVHIDGARYRLVDRKAKVGEKVLIVNARPLLPYSHVGEVVEIIGTDGDTYGGMLKPYDIGEKGAVYRFQYRVLESVEPAELVAAEEGDDVLTVDESEASKSVIDLLANLARRVTELERKLSETNKSQESSETHIFDVIHRIQNEIDGMYDKYREVDDKIEMILDDIVTLDERTQPLVALVKAVRGDE
jgi:hypothetical protein